MAILEEERCWREYKQRKREVGSRGRRSKPRTDDGISDASGSLPYSRSDSAEREWRRSRKRRLEEAATITASAAGPTTALDFWRQVVRASDDRWGHDGFAELENPGPPVPMSIEKRESLQPVGPPQVPLASSLSHAPKSSVRVPSPNSSPSSSTSSSSTRLKKRHKRKKKKKKKKKSGKKRRKSGSPSSGSCTTDIEWVENCP
ncbi:unnamed protein product [Mesocestoides corti]|uniref:Uncharacterized protein n=1 Tax=Mesocestoides corti TaxID=53468 RepID=A0A0R3U6Z8_MESCO|nr:unnamed protein product [Mesocestoides corti]